LFLKTLRHPGIPLVYDVEEDLDHSYLIEEYLEGESLYSLVKRLGKLSMKTTVDIGIQICRIIQFMNTAEKPILYLDLQPKNLLVCNGMVRLIDFDHAEYANEVESFGDRYGTVGFAAPEQFLGEPLDLRTDVYAIGALLYFMCRGKAPGREPEFGDFGTWRGLERIVRGCMAQKKEDRYQNAEAVECALKEWNEQNLNDNAIKSLNIIFAGAKEGCGTTHAALGLSNFLARKGCPTLYQEEYDTDTVRNLARNLSAKSDSAGVYHIGCLNILPFYGKSIKLPYHYYPVVIKDTGVCRQWGKDMPEGDFYVLVCGGKWWETDAALHAARQLKEYGKLVLLWNHMSDEAVLKLPADLRDVPCLNLPFFANPFKRNRLSDACFRKLCEIGAGGAEIWDGKRRKKKFWRKRSG
ncbi:MAG: serine/threonine protein kinase, partial [Eubacterium sp.]|nr:serine/threonine protein kinase [Eubacterium sp.]